MLKRIISDKLPESSPQPFNWIDLEALAEVELSSEDSDYPIEAALLSGVNQGWRASVPGQQTIRLVFKVPQHIHHIQLSFHESNASRTQEFLLQWSPEAGALREITRQQWNFCPEGSTTELEDYRVDLPGTGMIELIITPDISGQDSFASLSKLRIA
jgi:hypothetical protein